MCVSDGAPKHPSAQDEKQKGMQELWAFLRDRNAVFLGDPTLLDDLTKFLKTNKIKRGKTSDKQKDYLMTVEKVLAEV